MTLREVVAAMLRRWYVTAAAVLAVAVLGAAFWIDGGIYHSKTVVWFMMPSTSTLSVENGSKNGDVIAFAGAIATELNRGRPAPRYSSNSAPFYGAGVREGILVGLRDDGSQWGSSFGIAVIDVEVVGRTEAAVRGQQDEVIERIRQLADEQLAAGPTAAKDRVTLTIEPLTRGVEFVGASRVARVAAVGALLAAGLIVAAGAAVTADRIALARVTSRRRGTARTRQRSVGEGPRAHTGELMR